MFNFRYIRYMTAPRLVTYASWLFWAFSMRFVVLDMLRNPTVARGLNPLFVLYFLFIVLPPAWNVFVRRRTLAEFGFVPGRLGLALALGLLGGVAGALASAGPGGVSTALSSTALLPALAAMAYISVAEETFFRTWVQVDAEEAFGTFIAVVVSGAFFGLYHFWAPSVITLIPYFILVGLINGILFKFTGTIIAGALTSAISSTVIFLGKGKTFFVDDPLTAVGALVVALAIGLLMGAYGRRQRSGA